MNKGVGCWWNHHIVTQPIPQQVYLEIPTILEVHPRQVQCCNMFDFDDVAVAGNDEFEDLSIIYSYQMLSNRDWYSH